MGDYWDCEGMNGVGTTYGTGVIRGRPIEKAEQKTMDTKIVRREWLL